MKITLINYNQTQKNNSGYCDKSALTFKTNIKLKKVQIKNPDYQILNDKIALWINKIPKLSITKSPIKVPIKNGVIEFIVDKTKSKNTDVYIRKFDKFNIDKENKSKDNFTSALDIVVNENGQVIKGLYYDKRERMDYCFTRSEKNCRRILYGNVSYKPSIISDNTWDKIVPDMRDFQYYSTLDKIELNRSDFEKYFSELIKKDSSLFVK